MSFPQYLDEHPPKESNCQDAKTGLHDAKVDLLRATGDDAKKLGNFVSDALSLLNFWLPDVHFGRSKERKMFTLCHYCGSVFDL